MTLSVTLPFCWAHLVGISILSFLSKRLDYGGVCPVPSFTVIFLPLIEKYLDFRMLKVQGNTLLRIKPLHYSRDWGIETKLDNIVGRY